MFIKNSEFIGSTVVITVGVNGGVSNWHKKFFLKNREIQKQLSRTWSHVKIRRGWEPKVHYTYNFSFS